MLRCSRKWLPLEASEMRCPSTRTTFCAVLVPRINRLERLPRPPELVTCTPGTRFSRSMTLEGCRRSMSSRVKTLVATLLLLRACTSRLALITVSDNFSAWSSEGLVSASMALGARAMARARRDSFILFPQRSADIRGGQEQAQAQDGA